MSAQALTSAEQAFLQEHLSSCRLCPRRCGADRLGGQTGFCGADSRLRVGRAALHFWEEPCLSGSVGSGTVFFSYCTLQCVFCQNYAISTEHDGVQISIARLAEIFLELQAQGAWNINLVTPTHYIPQIILAVRRAKATGLTLPVVYNTSGYEVQEAIRLLRGTVDIYLPDLKYASEALAVRYSHAPGYTEFAIQAMEEMLAQVGEPAFASDGRMLRGLIIRHLLLPGQIEDTKAALRRIVSAFGDHVFVSLMNQYTPFGHVEAYPELAQTVDPLDYKDAVSYAQFLGIRRGFIQEDETAKESFIPSFLGEGVEKQANSTAGGEMHNQ